jgi:hypothetical protein
MFLPMDFLSRLKTAELCFGDFLLPWGMVIGAMGFLLAWIILVILERKGWTRRVWNLPLFLVALALLCGCVLGLVFAP